MLSTSQWVFLVIGCCATFALFLIIFGQHLFRTQNYFPKRVITPFEQKMFLRLNEAFPHNYVLPQVAFSALITSDQYKYRARFNRKVTDFVILNHDMNVIAIIELDDPTHIGKEKQDAERDYMLNQAGYQVFRYTDIPSIQTLKQDIAN